MLVVLCPHEYHQVSGCLVSAGAHELEYKQTCVAMCLDEKLQYNLFLDKFITNTVAKHFYRAEKRGHLL